LGSQAWTEERSTSSASTALSPPPVGVLVDLRLDRAEERGLPLVAVEAILEDGLVRLLGVHVQRWCASEVKVRLASRRPSFRRKKVGLSRNRLRS